jgi:hypothetical protein
MAKLATETESERLFRSSKAPHRYFDGWLTADKFRVHRIIDSEAEESDDLPEIRGVMEPLGNGTVVHVQMHLHASAKVFRTIVMLFAAAAFVSTTIQAPHWISTATVPLWLAVPLFALTPLASLTFLWALPRLGVDAQQASLQRQKLIEIFEGSSLAANVAPMATDTGTRTQ